ncbi:MAG TPA: hypothetical protein VIJ09_12680 [Acidimicrobiales bacterium]
MVSGVEIGRDGRPTGVRYFHDGFEHFQRARRVLAGYAIETPRLLLNSACSLFPDSPCNDFDQVRPLRDGPGSSPSTTSLFVELISRPAARARM